MISAIHNLTRTLAYLRSLEILDSADEYPIPANEQRIDRKPQACSRFDIVKLARVYKMDYLRALKPIMERKVIIICIGEIDRLQRGFRKEE